MSRRHGSHMGGLAGTRIELQSGRASHRQHAGPGGRTLAAVLARSRMGFFPSFWGCFLVYLSFCFLGGSKQIASQSLEFLAPTVIWFDAEQRLETSRQIRRFANDRELSGHEPWKRDHGRTRGGSPMPTLPQSLTHHAGPKNAEMDPDLPGPN